MNGETISELTGSLSITRSNAAQNAVGNYARVLVPSGLSARNYSIQYTNGDYMILGAGNALVRVAGTEAQYSTAANYFANMTAQYFNGTSVSNLAKSNNGFYQVTGTAGSASFVISAVAPTNSSSGNLSVGAYNISPTIISNTFGGLTVVGSLNVTPKILDVNNLGITSVSKVYDGATNISGLSLSVNSAQSAVVMNDIVNIAATGTYADKNVGVNKAVDINVVLGGADARNYALSSPRVQGNYGTITQLPSVTWVGANNGGRWSNAANWLNGALPDLSNVAQVIIPAGVNVLFDSALVGQVNTNIVNRGTITFNGVNNFDFNSNVSGAGNIVQSGLGVLTISGDNSGFTGSVNINASTLRLASFNALGAGTVVSNGGGLGATTTLSSLSVNGAVTLMTDITTAGNQIYNGPVILGTGDSVNGVITPLNITANNANIVFNSTLYSGAASVSSGRSLTINAGTGTVTFNDLVGQDLTGTTYLDFVRYGQKNIYQLDVTAGLIAINADISTLFAQNYMGKVVMGDNGTNGLERTLTSMDPKVEIFGPLDDAIANTHSPVLRAIAERYDANNLPELIVHQNIGAQSAFKNPIQYIMGIQDTTSPGAMVGDFDLGSERAPLKPTVYGIEYAYVPPVEGKNNFAAILAKVEKESIAEVIKSAPRNNSSVTVGAALVEDDGGELKTLEEDAESKKAVKKPQSKETKDKGSCNLVTGEGCDEDQ